MRTQQKPCPECGKPMHRQSQRCRECQAKRLSSPEFRAAMSEQRKGRPSYERTPEHRQRQSEIQKGRPNPALLGRKRPEHSAAMREWWTDGRRQAARERGLLAAEDYEWRLRIAQSVMGEKNPNHQGKGKATPYAPGFGRAWRLRMKARAAGKCERCGREGLRLDLHHKDFGKSDHTPENLAVICRSCHKALHYEHDPNWGRVGS